MATVYAENFVTIRPTDAAMKLRAEGRVIRPPLNPDELDYRDLLAEANDNYFHGEYGIALQNYLALRQKILVQSHPELPHEPGVGRL